MEWDLISQKNYFGRKVELFGPPFSISNLKVLRSHSVDHSLDFNRFFIIEECSYQGLDISAN